MGREYTKEQKEIGRRFAYARKARGMTQTDFAKRLGLSRSFVSQVEAGFGVYSERTASEICRVLSISKKWIETGEGDKFDTGKKEEAISSLFADVLQGDDNFKTKIITGLSRLSEKDWIVLEKLCDKVIGEDTEG